MSKEGVATMSMLCHRHHILSIVPKKKKSHIVDILVFGGLLRLIAMNLFVIVQSPSRVQLFATPWTAACQTSLSLTISRNLPKFLSLNW